MRILVIFVAFLSLKAMDFKSLSEIEPPLIFEIQSDTRLYDTIGEKSPEYLRTDTLWSQNEKVLSHAVQITLNQKKYSLIFESRPDGTLLHSGLLLFPERPFVINPEIQRFIERYFLELLLSDKPKEALAQDRISLSYNGQSFGTILFRELDIILPSMINAGKFTIYNKGYNYIAEWVQEKHVIWFSFPANLQLISGKDKRELDGTLIRDLLDQIVTFTHPLILFQSDLVQDSTGLLIQTGSEYFPGISQTSYFIHSDVDTLLVFDIIYPRESLINFLKYPGAFDVNFTVELEIKTRNPLSVTIPYDTFIQIIGQDYEIFTGIEEETTDSYQSIVLFKSKKYDHIHLCILSIPSDFFEKSEQKWTGLLYPYIRQDNLTNLFAKIRPGTVSEPVPIKLESNH